MKCLGDQFQSSIFSWPQFSKSPVKGDDHPRFHQKATGRGNQWCQNRRSHSWHILHFWTLPIINSNNCPSSTITPRLHHSSMHIMEDSRCLEIWAWAAWCPPCKVIAPILDSIAVDFSDRLRVFKVNSDERPELAARYEVMSVPTILVFSEGELLQRSIGARSRARLLEELGEVVNLRS